MYSSESQGDTLMRRKLERVGHQADPPLTGPGHQPAPGTRRASHFLANSTAGDTASAVDAYHMQQSRSLYGDTPPHDAGPVGPVIFTAVEGQFLDRPGDAASLTVPTVDFTDNAPAGSYFNNRKQQQSEQPPPSDAVEGAQQATRRQRMTPYPEHLAAQRRAMMAVITQREEEASDAQRLMDDGRRQYSRDTRDASRLKRRQQERRRIELQTTARQLVPLAKLQEFGVVASADDDAGESDDDCGAGLALSTGPTYHTKSSNARRSQGLLPTLTHLEANAARLDVAAQHREACIAAHRAKAARRVATEERLGTSFAATAAALRSEVRGSPTGHTLRLPEDGGRQAPALDAVHESRQLDHRHRLKQHGDRCEVLRLRAEMAAMDAAVLRSVHRVRTMDAAAKQRVSPDVPFTIDAPFRQRDSPVVQATASI